jgi:hypothetical protein
MFWIRQASGDRLTRQHVHPCPRNDGRLSPCHDQAPPFTGALDAVVLRWSTMAKRGKIYLFIDFLTNCLVDRRPFAILQVMGNIDLSPRPLSVLSLSRQIALSSAATQRPCSARIHSIPSPGASRLQFFSALGGRSSRGSLVRTRPPPRTSRHLPVPVTLEFGEFKIVSPPRRSPVDPITSDVASGDNP